MLVPTSVVLPLKAIVLPSVTSAPPTVELLPPLMKTPAPPLPRLSRPPESVPIEFPSMSVLAAVRSEMPAPALPAMMLREPVKVVGPPIWFRVPLSTSTPLLPLPRAARPIELVPMKLPWMLLVAPPPR